jgi:dTDP-glucose pyrophosphorylase
MKAVILAGGLGTRPKSFRDKSIIFIKQKIRIFIKKKRLKISIPC